MSVSVEDDYPYNSETFCEEVRNKLNHEFFETEAFLESLKENIFDIFGDGGKKIYILRTSSLS